MAIHLQRVPDAPCDTHSPLWSMVLALGGGHDRGLLRPFQMGAQGGKAPSRRLEAAACPPLQLGVWLAPWQAAPLWGARVRTGQRGGLRSASGPLGIIERVPRLAGAESSTRTQPLPRADRHPSTSSAPGTSLSRIKDPCLGGLPAAGAVCPGRRWVAVLEEQPLQLAGTTSAQAPAVAWQQCL